MERALTKQDVQALRKADTIVFHHDRPEQRTNGTAGRVRCIKKTPKSVLERDPFAPQEREHEIDVESWIRLGWNSVPDGYEQGEFRDKLRAASVEYIYSDEIRTITQLVRPGDYLKLDWHYDSGNDYTTKNKLFWDRFRVNVFRPGKRPRTYTFHVRDSVCEDNTARMISSWF